MLRPVSHALIGALLLLLSLGSASAARADSGMLTATLGRWLDTEVLPQLGRELAGHPRFKGETIKLVSLNGSQPTDQESRLHQTVKAHLTQRLLASSGVRIAWSDQPQQSCGVSQQADYLLGVAIEPDGSGYYKLNIGMIDVAESVWVSGVNHTWRGRLTATEAAALRQPVAAAPEGTIDNPLPAHANSQIARAMHQHLRCAHPEGLDGPVYLAPPEDPTLNRVLASLRTELASAPIAALTFEPAGAEWTMTLTSTRTGAGNQTGQLGLLLTEQHNQVTQQVSTIYVSGIGTGSRPGYPTTQIARVSMLSNLRVEPAEDEGICDSRAARGNQCAEVSFDLHEPAYLFVLASSNRQLSTGHCDSKLVEASAGERRFRVRVPPSQSNLPDAGLYAIAVRDRSTAKSLSRHIRTGVCSRPLDQSESWLRELDAMVAEHSDDVEWRAVHLTHAPGGVERL